jgi:hypothetical protein
MRGPDGSEPSPALQFAWLLIVQTDAAVGVIRKRIKMRRIAFIGGLTIALLVVAAQPLSANFVFGQFAPGGTTVRVTPNEILFYNLPGFVPPSCPPGPCPPTGNFQVLPPTSGSFSGRAGEIATIKNLTRDPGNSPPLAFAPVDTALAIMDFIMLSAAPAITFELTRLTSGMAASGFTAPVCDPALTATPGYRCVSDPGSPFLLTNVQTSVGGPINTNVSMNALALAWFTATPGEKSNATIALGTTFAGQTIRDIFAQLSARGFVESALSGSIVVTAVPEPATWTVVGIAMVGLVLISRRKARR